WDRRTIPYCLTSVDGTRVPCRLDLPRPGRSAPSFEPPAQLSPERRPAELQAGDDPVGVDQERDRDVVDAEGLDQVAAAGRVVDLLPGELAGPDEVGDRGGGLVE